MAGRIPDKFIDELLARVDIVDVIEQRVPLKKAGRDWSARCPFHDERSPSFTVSPAKQFYHCFGCGKHGSAIKFLMDYDRLEFVDAVEELATQAGLKVPYEGGARRAPQEDSTDLYALLDSAAKYYQRQLGQSDKARAYFDARGLDAQTIERFALGYSPDQWDALKNALGTTPQRIALLEKGGMLTSGERGTKYDRFRDRVMFPIQDRRGRVIAFGGRTLAAAKTKSVGEQDARSLVEKSDEGSPVLDARAQDAHSLVEKSGEGSPVLDARAQDARSLVEEPGEGSPALDARVQDARKGKDEGPKYLNSPETPLFHKGQQLFALWQVRQAHSKIPRLIVVEGYMDVIALFQHGITQAVATLGTATTRDHAELLFRNCADVYFCFDGDRAGRQAAWRAVESVLPRMRDGRQGFFLFLPDGEDPDSLVRSEGQAGFEQRLKDAMPLSEFFFAELGKDVNLSSLDGKARLAERARPLLTQIPDGAFRDLMLDELDERAKVRLRVEMPAAERPRGPARAQERTLLRAAVSLLVQNPGFVRAIEPPHLFATLRQPGIALLVELIALCRDRPEISTAGILEHFGEREELRALQKLAVMDVPEDEDAARTEFLGALGQLDRQTQQQRLDDLLAKKADVSLGEDEKDELRRLLQATKPAPTA